MLNYNDQSIYWAALNLANALSNQVSGLQNPSKAIPIKALISSLGGNSLAAESLSSGELSLYILSLALARITSP